MPIKWPTTGGGGGGGGAPTNAKYVVTQADATLTQEVLLSAVLLPPAVLASRPAAGTAGRLYWATDNGVLYYDNGATWQAVGVYTSTGAIETANLANDAVTYAKIQNISATDRLLGRDTAGAGDAEELTVGGGVEFTGSGGIQRSALTGDATAAAGSNATTVEKIRGNAVTAGTPTYGEGYLWDGSSFAPVAATTTVLVDNGKTIPDVVTNETALGGTAPTIPAAAFLLGASFAIDYDIAVTNSTGGNITVAVMARLGAADLQSITTSNIATGTIQAVSGRIYLTVGTAGAAGIIRGKHHLIVGGNFTSIASQQHVVGAPSAAIDLTGPLALDLRVVKSSANASLDVVSRFIVATYSAPV